MTRKLAIFSTVAIAALSVALTSAPSAAADIVGLVTKTNTNPFFVMMKKGFDAKANAWHTLAPMPRGRHAAGATSDGTNLYVGGGSFLPGGQAGGPTGELMVFKLP